MGYSQALKNLFPGTTLEAEDMLLLETFQIKYLPDRVPETEFSVVLRSHPVVHRFLELKHPPIAGFINEVLSKNPPENSQVTAKKLCQDLLWEIADLIIYNKHPDVYDAQSGLTWEIGEISSITSLEGKIVLDAGAGTGRLSFLVSEYAETVFALEPVNSMRRFIREKAVRDNVNNLYVVDGFLDSIPFPENSFDVLMCSNAVGWNLAGELKEIERVLKPGAYAILLFKTMAEAENPLHEVLISTAWNYSFTELKENDELRLKYFKTVN